MLLTALIYLYGKVCGFGNCLCTLRMAVFGAIGIELGLIKADFRLIWAYFGGQGAQKFLFGRRGGGRFFALKI